MALLFKSDLPLIITVNVSTLLGLEKNLVALFTNNKSDLVLTTSLGFSVVFLSLLQEINNVVNAIKIILYFIVVLLFVQYKNDIICH